MSTGIAWVFDDDSVEKAAKIMSERQVRRLPRSRDRLSRDASH
jgi:CBS domain-containing protein